MGAVRTSTDRPTLSRILLGTYRLERWGLDDAALARHLEACVELGVTSVDTADVYAGYACEERLGAALRRSPGLRERLQLVTKTGILFACPAQPRVRVKHYDTSRAHVVAQVERSLRALGTDRLDLLLLHRPDPLLEPDEIAEAFVALRDAGKVRAFGVSNFAPSQVELLRASVPVPLVANQVEISLAHTEPLFDGTLDQTLRHGMIPMAWSPLGGGRLLEDAVLTARLWEIAAQYGHAAADQVALAWLLRHPAGIHPVVGTGNLDRVRGAVGALALKLDRQAWFALLEAARGHAVP